MRQKITEIMLISVLVIGILAAGCTKPAETVGPAVTTTAPPVTDLLEGRAFISGNSGHVTVLDFAINPHTNEVEILKMNRIAANDSQGKSYGYKKASHTVQLSKDGKTLYWAALDGTIIEVDLDTLGLTIEKAEVGGLKQFKTFVLNVEWTELGGQSDGKHCGSSISPDGSTLYVSSMKSGAVLVYDTQRHAKVNRIVVDEYLSAVEITPDGKYLYGTNMVKGKLSKLDFSSGKVINTVDLTSAQGYFVHAGKIDPTGKYLWLAAGNEYKDGKPYGLEGLGRGALIKYDITNDKVVETIEVPGLPHSVGFSKDGKYVITSVRRSPKDSSSGLVFIDTEGGNKVIDNPDLCTGCHKEVNVNMSKFVDNETQLKEVSFASGIDIAWQKTK